MSHTCKPTKLRTRVLFVFLFAFALASKAHAETFVVDRLTDTGDGEQFLGDLRYCITNATSGEDVIVFAVTGTINLTSPLPDLNVSVTIEGPGADLLTVRRDTGGDYGIFTVSRSATVSLSGLSISNGYGNFAGGISNSGTLTISNSTISGNSSPNGGGISNSGTLTISNSTISGNLADFYAGGGSGGGIRNATGATLTVSNSTISGNSAVDGGGISNGGTLTVSSSTLAYNGAGHFSSYGSGGGISNWGSAVISDSTLSGNGATGGDADYGIGGGIYNSFYTTGATLTVSNSTISGNFAGQGLGNGGGIYNGRTLHMRNTILAGNRAYPYPSDLDGRLTSSGYNLIGNTRGGSGYDGTDLLDVDPLLGPLQNNGGPTFTHALLEGSPAIDSGDNTDAPAWDQRGEGFPRIVNDVIDRGAFEVQVAADLAPRLHIGAGAFTDNRKFGLTRTPVYYPSDAIGAGKGAVLLDIMIDSHGRVVDAQIRRSVPVLDDLARQARAKMAVRTDSCQWAASPCRINGASFVSADTTLAHGNGRWQQTESGNSTFLAGQLTTRRPTSEWRRVRWGRRVRGAHTAV